MDKEILRSRIAEIRKDIRSLSWDGAELVAVTKTVDVETTNLLKYCDQKCIGENRVQTIMQKMEKLDSFFDLHFIGRLQTNKIRYIIKDVSLFHSVDRLNLIEELNEVAKKYGLVKDILIQVNIAKEPQKAGFGEEDLPCLMNEIHKYDALSVKGLMAIMPFIDDELRLASYFRGMRQLFEYYKEVAPKNVDMNFLSMGMSHDYKIALQEGANIIRVGSALFSE